MFYNVFGTRDSLCRSFEFLVAERAKNRRRRRWYRKENWSIEKRTRYVSCRRDDPGEIDFQGRRVSRENSMPGIRDIAVD